MFNVQKLQKNCHKWKKIFVHKFLYMHGVFKASKRCKRGYDQRGYLGPQEMEYTGDPLFPTYIQSTFDCHAKYMHALFQSTRWPHDQSSAHLCDHCVCAIISLLGPWLLFMDSSADRPLCSLLLTTPCLFPILCLSWHFLFTSNIPSPTYTLQILPSLQHRIHSYHLYPEGCPCPHPQDPSLLWIRSPFLACSCCQSHLPS